MTTTLLQTLWPASPSASIHSAFTRNVLLALVGALLLTVSAKIQIPFWPVPLTMQTYVVLVLGMAYGARLGTATIASYLMMGVMGLPVFAGTPEKGIGLGYMMGPTGGYLLGFMVAAWVCGKLAERGFDRSHLKALFAMSLGHVLIIGLGVTWLATNMGWDMAITLGLTPFILATVAKTLLGLVTLPLAWKLLELRRP